MFRLQELQHTWVSGCCHVVEEHAPVLHVIRGSDGSWYFDCGNGHGREQGVAKTVELKELVKRDPTLNALASLSPHDFAERPAADQPWTVGDQLALEIPECIREHGWFIALVNDEANHLTSHFAYSIGMPVSIDTPEMLILGGPTDLMPRVINELGQRAKAGPKPLTETPIDNLIAGHRCIARMVHKTWYRDYMGYALWFHGSEDFNVMQIVWSDEEGRFPWEEGCNPIVRDSQPDLSKPKQ